MRDLTLNRLRDSEKSKILRDLNTTLEAGFAIILARDAVLRKKMVFGIEMTEFRDVVLSWKRDQTPPPPPPQAPSQTLFQRHVFFQGEVRTHLLYGR